MPGDEDIFHSRIARHWGILALKGAALIMLGLFAVFWPGVTLVTLVVVFAVYCILDAILSVILAVHGARHGGRWAWPALTAVVALAAAAIALRSPGFTLIMFAIMLAVWAIVTGVFTLAAGLRLRGDHGRWWLVAEGAALTLLGLILAFMPPLALFTLVWMVAVGAVASGVALLGLASRLRSRDREHGHRAGRGLPGAAASA